MSIHSRCSSFMILSLLSVLSVSLAIASTDAEKVSQQMLEFRFNTQDASSLSQRIEESHAELTRRALEDPTQESKAMLLFSQPQIQAELVELARRYSLEVTAVRHVTITRTRTFSGGFTTLESFAGDLGEKLTFFTKQLLARTDKFTKGNLPFQQTPPKNKQLQASIVEAMEASAERKQRILEEGLRFYEMQAIGALSDLSHLQQVESHIAVVRLIKSPSLPEGMRKKLLEKFPDGLPKLPLPPLEPSTGDPHMQTQGIRVFSDGSDQPTRQNETGSIK